MQTQKSTNCKELPAINKMTHVQNTHLKTTINFSFDFFNFINKQKINLSKHILKYTRLIGADCYDYTGQFAGTVRAHAGHKSIAISKTTYSAW